MPTLYTYFLEDRGKEQTPEGTRLLPCTQT